MIATVEQSMWGCMKLAILYFVTNRKIENVIISINAHLKKQMKRPCHAKFILVHDAVNNRNDSIIMTSPYRPDLASSLLRVLVVSALSHLYDPVATSALQNCGRL